MYGLVKVAKITAMQWRVVWVGGLPDYQEIYSDHMAEFPILLQKIAKVEDYADVIF